MCQFKSGIIFKNRTVLTPTYNDSHSSLLEKLNVEDNLFNAEHVFVRAELLPPKGNLNAPVSDWKFSVDQDIVPEWFSEDKEKYEEEFKKAVSDWWDSVTRVVCGNRWIVLKETEEESYCLLANDLDETHIFNHNNNNYKDSTLRTILHESSLFAKLKKELGDNLLPIHLSLAALNGSKEYGDIDGDLISLMNLDLYREYSENIPRFGRSWWLATSLATPKNGNIASYVCCVYGSGAVDWGGCDYRRGVRPFCIFKSSIFKS